MSLINKMLQDLEARRAVDMFADGRLQPLPAISAVKPAKWLWLAALAAIVGAAAFWLIIGDDSQTRVAPQPALVAPPPAAVVPPQETPPATDPAPPSASADAAAQPPGLPVEQGAASPDMTGLRLETKIPDAPVAPTPSAQKARRTPGEITPGAPRPEVPTSAAVSRIEKRDTPLAPRARAEALMLAAKSSHAAGRNAEARNLLHQSLEEDPGFAAPRWLLLRDALDRRALTEAETILREAMQHQPKQAEWPLALARLHVEQGDVAKARSVLAEAQPAVGANADYLGFLGALSFRQGQMSQAAEAYQRAAAMAPNEGRWWLGLGLALEADHRPADAREAFLRARATGSLNADLQAVADQKLR